MLHKIEIRLSRLEKTLATTTRKPPVCNCKEEIRYHNSVCLDTLLKKMPRVCLVHGFRELGFFIWIPSELTLLPGDNQFCPCIRQPSDFIQGPGPHTIAGLYSALDAYRKAHLIDPTNFAKDYVQADALCGEYLDAQKLWFEKTGKHSPNRRELAKLRLQNVRRFEELRLQVRDEYRQHLAKEALA
jgi:hypothetical protein